MKNETRRNVQGEKTRQSIFNAAAQLFAKRGYDNVSIRDISGEVDITPSLVIHHFRNKASLYRKTIQHFFGNGDLYVQCIAPITKVNVADKQACSNAIAESVHLFFDCWHGPNRIRNLDRLMLQILLGRGALDFSQTLDLIRPTEAIFEKFLCDVNPAFSSEESDVRFEIFLGAVCFPAVARNILLSEHGWNDYPVDFLLRWKKVIASDFCLGCGLPSPTYVFPDEGDADYYKKNHKPTAQIRSTPDAVLRDTTRVPRKSSGHATTTARSLDNVLPQKREPRPQQKNSFLPRILPNPFKTTKHSAAYGGEAAGTFAIPG